MSTFKVTVEEIETIKTHPDADALELGSVKGLSYQFVVRKGVYKPGDLVVYFPIDSLIPEWVQDALGVKGYLAGSAKNRVKTIKLRGMISQGLVTPLSDMLSKMPALFTRQPSIGDDLTALLGVTKYEPPVTESQDGIMSDRPPEVAHYDIESCDRYPDIVAELLDVPVYVSEKLEGSHQSITLRTDGTTVVCTRNHALRPKDDATQLPIRLALVQQLGLDEILQEISEVYGKQPITLRGEIIGPGWQGNYYELKSPTLRFFDVEAGGISVLAEHFRGWLPPSLRVPELAFGITLREFLAGRTVQEVSTGPSALNPKKLREGIVIKPLLEQLHPKIGRLFLKQRSPEYLAKTGM